MTVTLAVRLAGLRHPAMAACSGKATPVEAPPLRAGNDAFG
ncbi:MULTISPECIES: hypothetical protein [unclassified Variovorax]|nr:MULTISPECIES: hypothetical protein [unclassified Variovorax]